MTVRKLLTDCVKFTEPSSEWLSPVVAETIRTVGTRVLLYQSDDQKSIKTTERQMARDYLEIPEPRLPRVFLDLAEETRNVKIESGRSWYTEEAQSQGTGLTRSVFITVMEYSSPVLQTGAVRASVVSAEMIQIMDSAGRREPVDRSGLLGPQNKTKQPVLLGLNAYEVGNAPAGPVGPDVNVAGRREPVDRSGLVGPQSTTEQPVLLGLDTDEMGNAPAGPVGPDVISAGRGETVDRSGLVGPQNRTEQPVFLGLYADQMGHVPAGPVDPDVKMYRTHSVADGPVGQNKTRRPVGTAQKGYLQ